ncbi:hypothetical protein PLICRDRAFT_188544 [Plicaturopsis crispa FD-325 SS-3]|nr:hypothetical protein PLICRDRAFT_188544 [Plicaturopsis crispa FD-325 SS-3]
MYHLDSVRDWLLSVLLDPLFQQIAPLVVLLVFPLLVLLLSTRISKTSLFWSFAMVLESLGLHWGWSSKPSASAVTHEKRKSKKKHVRTRADQVANGIAQGSDGTEDGYYPGLVNISGTYCFMNSTIQAFASLCYLQPHIESVHAKAEALDVPSPVIDALLDLLHILNAPKSAPSAIRPLDIINALSNRSTDKHNSLFSSREHQDAQELFQLLSECIKDEAIAIEKEGYRDRGLGGLAQISRQVSRDTGKSVFDGLTANRRSCVECGYTEAVMHFPFDSWQLAVPRLSSSCSLEECLAEYTHLEVLTDCICRKCSMLATHRRLADEAQRLSEAALADGTSTSKKRRAREARRLEARVKEALDQGRIEDELKGIKMEKVFSAASTKQAMIARPPPVLALHINRSISYGQYASKNNIRVVFPEVLDLTPFTTSGNLSTTPSLPISSPPPAIPRSTTPTPATYATPRTVYRLASVVCHYGQHSFGHYVCYRRKPRPVSSGASRFAPPQLADPLGCECEKCRRFGPVRDDSEADVPRGSGRGWLRVSDDAVRECGIESVLQEGAGAFMLYYERVVQARPGIYPLSTSPRSSEETLKPEMMKLSALANGSATSLLSADERRVGRAPEEKVVGRVSGPRIVRSVAAGRGRSLSAAPSDREAMSIPKPTDAPLANGHATEVPSLSASLPILPSSARRPLSPEHRTPSPSSSSLSHRSSPRDRIQAPQPIQAVGL